jgi:hypothetical protein
MARMPDEVLLHIFSQVDSGRDLANVRAVCHRWHQLCEERNQLWEGHLQRDFGYQYNNRRSFYSARAVYFRKYRNAVLHGKMREEFRKRTEQQNAIRHEEALIREKAANMRRRYGWFFTSHFQTNVFLFSCFLFMLGLALKLDGRLGWSWPAIFYPLWFVHFQLISVMMTVVLLRFGSRIMRTTINSLFGSHMLFGNVEDIIITVFGTMVFFFGGCFSVVLAGWLEGYWLTHASPWILLAPALCSLACATAGLLAWGIQYYKRKHYYHYSLISPFHVIIVCFGAFCLLLFFVAMGLQLSQLGLTTWHTVMLPLFVMMGAFLIFPAIDGLMACSPEGILVSTDASHLRRKRQMLPRIPDIEKRMIRVVFCANSWGIGLPLLSSIIMAALVLDDVIRLPWIIVLSPLVFLLIFFGVLVIFISFKFGRGV